MSTIKEGELSVSAELHALIEKEILPGTGVSNAGFWPGLEKLIASFGPRNRNLLQHRERMQAQIDAWHRANPEPLANPVGYRDLLAAIGYLVPEAPDFVIATENVDSEIAFQAGPQLVAPVKNARFALNAVNARWGSLYDALYGTDAIPESGGAEREGPYNPVRGDRVIACGRELLDSAAPLARGRHRDVTAYRVEDNELIAELAEDQTTVLADPQKLCGYQGDPHVPDAVLLRSNGLHLEIQVDRRHPVGSDDKAGVKDILVEAAITTIMDCEDSIAAVDAEDKCEVYANWLGLMKGTLEETFEKGGKPLTRTMARDRDYLDPGGQAFSLPGRSLLFVRNVGHLMTTPAVRDGRGREIPEGILDALVTAAAAIHDLRGSTSRGNSRTGSVYIVKPKMHGPEEVRFTVELFAAVEDILGLPENTLKIGIMDEERRTTVNLKACIEAASERLVFINTGFLDRTGDEIHTSMLAGPMVPKTEMKNTAWIRAYEDRNVHIGIACGLPGKAQIGKGMWAMPDEMAAMLEQKIAHPLAGASTAWVPSPNGAILHALHYHKVDVFARQQELAGRKPAGLEAILEIPILPASRELGDAEIQAELDNNAQGILGYVVRWIDQGVGCSKVPDINNIGLMEDRATLRISSQHIANWLEHGICTEAQVAATLKRMAAIVDEQNAGDAGYTPMAPGFEGIAFQTARELIFRGKIQPSGYTEPLLHAHRARFKAS